MQDARSAIANVRNPNQGQDKRVLCVCSAGMLRSATAQFILHDEYGYNTRAAGVAEYAMIPVNDVLLHWADEVVCMGSEHVKPVLQGLKNIGRKIPVYCLLIPDNYPWMDDALKKLILERYDDRINIYKGEVI